MSLNKRLTDQLLKRKQHDLHRKLHLKDPTLNLIDFSSNDYLGLAGIYAHSEEAVAFGSTGSRLLTGNSSEAVEIENLLADLWGHQSLLVYPSGYMANLGVLSSLPQRGDVVLMDQLSHASIKDGVRLSLATFHSFLHNDLTDLENKLKKCTGQVFIVVESVYSMDGDESPLEDLIDLAEKYGASVIVDEAHATAITGKSGGGIVQEKSLQSKVLATIYTFGKAIGYHGAGVAGAEWMIDYLINFSRPFIYTTALPREFYSHLHYKINYNLDHPYLINKLYSNIELFLNTLRKPKYAGLPFLTGKRAIHCFLCPGNKNAKQLSDLLKENGYDVRPILSPTVPRGKERLRVCLHSFNSTDEIVGLIDTLNRLV